MFHNICRIASGIFFFRVQLKVFRPDSSIPTLPITWPRTETHNDTSINDGSIGVLQLFHAWTEPKNDHPAVWHRYLLEQTTQKHVLNDVKWMMRSESKMSHHGGLLQNHLGSQPTKLQRYQPNWSSKLRTNITKHLPSSPNLPQLLWLLRRSLWWPLSNPTVEHFFLRCGISTTKNHQLYWKVDQKSTKKQLTLPISAGSPHCPAGDDSLGGAVEIANAKGGLGGVRLGRSTSFGNGKLLCKWTLAWRC